MNEVELNKKERQEHEREFFEPVDGAVDVIIKDEERQPCEIWTRVMGYFRPVSGWNIGKKQEHADRVYFSEKKSMKHIDTGCAA